MTFVSPGRPPRRWPVSRKVAPVRGWYRRWRTIIGEAWRFGIVGAANVVINFVVFNALALTLFPGGELKANIVATAVATTTSYLMNRGWTFRHRKTSRIPREYVLFFVFNALALGIELGVMGAAKYGLGLTTLLALNLAKAAGLGLGTVFRFWTYRTFVFAGEPAAPATVAAPAPAVAPVPLSRTEPAEALATARR
jgi:putative flippase GtrA